MHQSTSSAWWPRAHHSFETPTSSIKSAKKASCYSPGAPKSTQSTRHPDIPLTSSNQQRKRQRQTTRITRHSRRDRRSHVQDPRPPAKRPLSRLGKSTSRSCQHQHNNDINHHQVVTSTVSRSSISPTAMFLNSSKERYPLISESAIIMVLP